MVNEYDKDDLLEDQDDRDIIAVKKKKKIVGLDYAALAKLAVEQIVANKETIERAGEDDQYNDEVEEDRDACDAEDDEWDSGWGREW